VIGLKDFLNIASQNHCAASLIHKHEETIRKSVKDDKTISKEK